MRVIVATDRTQGDKLGDYCFTVDGELVRLPWSECDGPDCGCTRGFAGLSSHRATTTARVVNRPELDPAAYVQLLVDDAVANGFGPVDDELRRLVADEARHLMALAQELPLGSVLERLGDTTAIRRVGLQLTR
jgi:hypothetical protein